MVKSVKRILLKHPKDAFINQTKIDSESIKLNYTSPPDFQIACKQYDSFLKLIYAFNPDVHFMPISEKSSLDSIYTRDSCIITNNGIILCNMGKRARSNEPNEMNEYFSSIGIPIIGRIENPGTLEGGDILWIDDKTIAVAEGYRSNAEGIEQLKNILGNQVSEFISVPLPHWNGSKDCLHLMSNVSPIDYDLFLVYSRLLPVSFREYLLYRKIKLVEVSDEEYNSMGGNVLAMEKRKVIMVKGNPITQKSLENEGVEVCTYDGSEISLKGAGGPTCLTRPFFRSS